MLQLRGSNCGSYLAGLSVRNQRIEHLQRKMSGYQYVLSSTTRLKAWKNKVKIVTMNYMAHFILILEKKHRQVYCMATYLPVVHKSIIQHRNNLFFGRPLLQKTESFIRKFIPRFMCHKEQAFEMARQELRPKPWRVVGGFSCIIHK